MVWFLRLVFAVLNSKYPKSRVNSDFQVGSAQKRFIHSDFRLKLFVQSAHSQFDFSTPDMSFSLSIVLCFVGLVSHLARPASPRVISST
jgi:hypothetical protein